jgi:hypothetical protein
MAEVYITNYAAHHIYSSADVSFYSPINAGSG